jgi:hypothetical protein
MAHKRFLASVTDMATNSAHSLAFHRGLGVPTASASQTPYTKYLDASTIEYYSKIAYAKSNFAVVANGANHGEFSKWVSEFFDDVPAQPVGESTTGSEQTKYVGGEERIAHDGGNAMVIAFPGSSSFTGKFYKPELAVLSSLLGGQSAVKWSPGFTILGNAAAPGTKVTTTLTPVFCTPPSPAPQRVSQRPPRPLSRPSRRLPLARFRTSSSPRPRPRPSSRSSRMVRTCVLVCSSLETVSSTTHKPTRLTRLPRPLMASQNRLSSRYVGLYQNPLTSTC